MPADGKDSKHSHRIGGQGRVHSPQVGHIELAIRYGIPPDQQRVRNFVALTGAALCDLDQAIKCGSDILRNSVHHPTQETFVGRMRIRASRCLLFGARSFSIFAAESRSLPTP
jgi:hypothetical protein